MFTRGCWLRALVVAAVAAAVAALGHAHGNFSKPCFNTMLSISPTNSVWINQKINASTRGSAGGLPTVLYMMDPPLNHTGTLDWLGWRIMVQDEEAATIEPFEMTTVKYAADGISPDPLAVIAAKKFYMFGVGGSGRTAREYLIITGWTWTMPVANQGVGFAMEAEPTWPVDGLSVQGQLNLPGDPLSPHVPPPYDSSVWAFEQPMGTAAPVALGGRKLDSLLYSVEWVIDPVLQHYLVSNAYGNGPEDLFGPESMYPVAARGDQLGFYLQGGNDGVWGVAFLLMAPTLLPTPFKLYGLAGNSPNLLIDPRGGYLVLQTGNPDPTHGRLRFPPFSFALVPPIVRDFWVQCVVAYPSSGLIRITDAVGVKGQ